MTNNDTPVVLFVFNRHENLADTLACLKANSITKLYVFSDGPRNQDDVAGIAKVREIIAQIDWVEAEIIEHQANQGLSQSIQNGLSYVFKKHETAIVVEDDIKIAPDFYNYAVQALEGYRQDKNVMGITGLRYPFKRDGLDAARYDAFFTPRFSSWGWATWRDRWQRVSFDLEAVKSAIKSKSDFDPSIAGADIPGTIQALLDDNLTGCWDVFVLIHMLLNNKLFVWPRYNMVTNTGLLEGSHANGIAPSWKLKWETNPSTGWKLPGHAKVDENILRDFRQFFLNISSKEGISMKQQVKAVLRKIKHSLEPTPPTHEPKEYSTTDEPMEVPCQKEAYYLALNKYMQDGDKVLDVGCGLGYGLNLLSIKAKSTYGVDVDPKAVEYCKQNILGKNPRLQSVQAYDGYSLPFKDKEFDIVTTVDVLEHVEDYDRFIDELIRVAKRAVIISTPNRRPEYTNPDGTPKNFWHLREWSHSELEDIVSSHGVKQDWNFINGPWDGPFATSAKVQDDTMTLTPALILK